MALTENKLGGTDKLKPKPAEYQDMSQALCDKYPSLKDLHAPNGEYWISVKEYLSQRFQHLPRNSDNIQTGLVAIASPSMPNTVVEINEYVICYY
uniref:Uncharacterized protein n=1 Tax=Amphimedon queenslandica TaxID=400682 RepID=A0A1X7UP81_AMPQE